MMRFADLGRTVAAVQDADRRAMRATERASQSFIRVLRHKPQAAYTMPWLAAAAAAMILVGVGGGLWYYSFAQRREVAQLQGVVLGQPIVVPEGREIPLNFSDGSRVELAAGSSANVVGITEQGATFELRSGKATASVIHRATTRWTMHAGPYRVAVTGTKFTLEWQPTKSHFELDLTDGSVVVTAENNSHAAVTMRSPEHLVIEQGEWHLSSSGQVSVSDPLPAPAVSDVPGPSPERRPAPAASSVASNAAVALPDAIPSVPEWQRLAKRGQYPAAYDSAQQLGIATLAQSASAPAMLALAEVCRFAGHASESMVVLTKLRQRYADSNEAAVAAFQLGRLSSDGQLAASWFRNYLKERPNGELAREASGRLIEALERAGDRVGARSAAESYLARYPSGPHAGFARRLTSP